jgi:Uma2 family endonuclease
LAPHQGDKVLSFSLKLADFLENRVNGCRSQSGDTRVSHGNGLGCKRLGTRARFWQLVWQPKAIPGIIACVSKRDRIQQSCGDRNQTELFARKPNVPHTDTGRFSAEDYDKAAKEYLKSLPLEHFMEATLQAMQREITVESLALLKRRRPDVQTFNELLVQYFFKGWLRQVVPDNMVIVSDEPPRARNSFNVELEPVPPLLVLEYVSSSNPRKDYKDSFRKYERELKVPYCLLFHPERQDLRLFRHTGDNYERLQPDAKGRYAIPELDLQVGLVEGWVRFWYRQRLLPLPAQLEESMEKQVRLNRQLKARLEQQDRQLNQMRERLSRRVEERARKADARIFSSACRTRPTWTNSGNGTRNWAEHRTSRVLQIIAGPARRLPVRRPDRQ